MQKALQTFVSSEKSETHTKKQTFEEVLAEKEKLIEQEDDYYVMEILNLQYKPIEIQGDTAKNPRKL